MNKVKYTLNIIISVFLITAVFSFTVLFPDSFGNLMLSWAVQSVGSIVPDSTGKFDEKEKSAETVKETLSYETEELDSYVKITDEDIKASTAEYEKKAGSDKKDGGISEENLHESGSTESYGRVYVKNTNKTKAEIKKHLGEKAVLSVSNSPDEPTVLIYHTHTTESYQIQDRDFYAVGFKSRSNSPETNMIRVGEAICSTLEKSGFSVIHDTNIYDSSYTGAYYRSYDAAAAIIEKHPSIQITLDIHRDAIQYDSGTKVKPTAVINGKKAAQIMIISGCQEKGNGIENFPDWEKNLTFALQLQNRLETDWAGLTRPVFFCPRDYNMNLTPCSLLIEIGTDGNTLEEAVYSGKMLGISLGRLMEKYRNEE